MQTKSYFAHTIEEAMDMAKRELGPDALLLNSKMAPPEARHLGSQEAVFAFPTGEGDMEALPAQGTGEEPLNGPLQRELAAFRSQMEDMRRVLARISVTPAAAGTSPEVSRIYEVLIQAGIDSELARDVVDSAARGVSSDVVMVPARPTGQDDADGWRHALAIELESRVTIDSRLDRTPDRPRVVMLLGPPGAGKTTTLVKLAVTRGLAVRKSVHLISLDNYRIGGADQLRSFAGILGVGFQALESTIGLDAAISEFAHRDLIFVDTPGFSSSTWEDSRELRSWLAAHPGVDTHLVLPASMSASDLTRTVDRYRAFAPSKLLFTRLDEADSWGMVLSESVRTGIPLSFLGTGQIIPEDFEPATAQSLVRHILRAIETPARSMAA